MRKAKVAFEKPGFELNNARFRLQTKDLKQLLDIQQIETSINAIPRIQAKQPLHATQNLADLEHAVTADQLTSYDKNGAKPLNGWLSEMWYLTALPQRFNPFRQSSPNIQLFRVMKNRKLAMCEKDDFGQYIDRSQCYSITNMELNDLEKQRLWLNRDYCDILRRLAVDQNGETDNIDEKIEALSKRYGEIMLPEYLEDKKMMYSDQFGLVVSDRE